MTFPTSQIPELLRVSCIEEESVYSHPKQSHYKVNWRFFSLALSSMEKNLTDLNWLWIRALFLRVSSSDMGNFMISPVL